MPKPVPSTTTRTTRTDRSPTPAGQRDWGTPETIWDALNRPQWLEAAVALEAELAAARLTTAPDTPADAELAFFAQQFQTLMRNALLFAATGSPRNPTTKAPAAMRAPLAAFIGASGQSGRSGRPLRGLRDALRPLTSDPTFPSAWQELVARCDDAMSFALPVPDYLRDMATAVSAGFAVSYPHTLHGAPTTPSDPALRRVRATLSAALVGFETYDEPWLAAVADTRVGLAAWLQRLPSAHPLSPTLTKAIAAIDGSILARISLTLEHLGSVLVRDGVHSPNTPTYTDYETLVTALTQATKGGAQRVKPIELAHLVTTLSLTSAEGRAHADASDRTPRPDRPLYWRATPTEFLNILTRERNQLTHLARRIAPVHTPSPTPEVPPSPVYPFKKGPLA